MWRTFSLRIFPVINGRRDRKATRIQWKSLVWRWYQALRRRRRCFLELQYWWEQQEREKMSYRGQRAVMFAIRATLLVLNKFGLYFECLITQKRQKNAKGRAQMHRFQKKFEIIRWRNGSVENVKDDWDKFSKTNYKIGECKERKWYLLPDIFNFGTNIWN